MKQKQSSFEKLFLGVAFLLLGASLYFLHDDSLLFGGRDGKGKEPIGVILSHQYDLRQKGFSDLSWFEGQDQTAILDGDSIFTGERSTASIRLKDGTAVDLEPNSLVVFTLDEDNQIQLNLEFGDLVGKVGNSTQVKLGNGEQVDTDGASLRLSKRKRGQAQVQVLKGHAKLKTLNGNIQSVKPQLKVTAKPLEVKDLVVIRPEPEKLYWATPGEAIDFQWANMRGEGPIFESSYEPDFKKLHSRSPAADSNFRLFQYEFDKTLFWRITSQTGPTLTRSPIQSLEVRRFHPLQVTSPKAFQIHTLGSETLRFAWDDPNGFDQYRLQVAQDSLFQKVVFQNLIAAREINAPRLTEGVYFLRVGPPLLSQSLANRWSEPIAFKIKKEVIAEVPIREPAQELDPEKTPLTATPFSVTHKARTGDDIGPPKEVELRWDQVEDAHSYEVQYSDQKDFSRLRKTTSTTDSATITLPQAGQYYWRIRSLNEKGEPLSDFSDPTALNYFLVGRESLPSIREPLDQTVYILGSNEKSLVWLHWTYLPDAENYEVEVSDRRSFTNQLYLEETKEARFLLSQRLTPGVYYWRVRAKIEGQYAQWTAPQTFIIKTK